MLFHNVGYHWGAAAKSCDGYIIQACGVDSALLMNARQDHDVLKGNALFDPQLYFAGLDPVKCINAVSRLATYPWFLSNAPPFDAEKMRPSEFRKEVADVLSLYIKVPSESDGIKTAIAECVGMQRNLGLKSIVIPAPLIDETGLNTYIKWIDSAIENDCVGDRDLVTLAICSGSFARSEVFIDCIIDNISSREAIRGVYVVVISDTASKRIEDQAVAEGLLRLSYELGRVVGLKVIINYADDFGLFCRAFGATAFGTCYDLKGRRAYYPDYEETDGWGYRYPYFYSNSLFCDFLSNDHLNQFRNAELLWFFDEDKTDSSRALLTALKEGKSANEVPQWRQEHNRIEAAKEHRMELLTIVNNSIDACDGNEQVRLGVQKIRQAHLRAEYCKGRILPGVTRNLSHIEVWKNACEGFSRRVVETRPTV